MTHANIKLIKNVEEAKCEVCRAIYPRRMNRKRRHSNAMSIRKRGSRTCSHKCSVIFQSERQKERNKLRRKRQKKAIDSFIKDENCVIHRFLATKPGPGRLRT